MTSGSCSLMKVVSDHCSSNFLSNHGCKFSSGQARPVLGLDCAIHLIQRIWKRLIRFSSAVSFDIKATWLTSYSFPALLVQSIRPPACVFNFAIGSKIFLQPFEYLCCHHGTP